MTGEAYNCLFCHKMIFSTSSLIDDRDGERGKYLPVSYEVIPATSSLIGDREYLNVMPSEACDLPAEVISG